MMYALVIVSEVTTKNLTGFAVEVPPVDVALDVQVEPSGEVQT